MVRAVEDIRVVGHAHLLERGQHAAHLRVHVARAGDGAHRLAADAGHQRLRGSQRLGRRLFLGAEAVMRELHEERLSGLELRAHELDAAVGDEGGLLRVRRAAALRPLVGVGTVAEVEAHRVRRGASHVPLTEVRRAVAKVMQHAAARLDAGGQVGVRRGRNHAHQRVARGVARLALVGATLVLVGHVQLGGADARHPARARRRAARARDVEVAEAHAVGRHLLEVGREARGTCGGRRHAVHVHRGARPSLRLGLDEDEVGARGLQAGSPRTIRSHRRRGRLRCGRRGLQAEDAHHEQHHDPHLVNPP